jgi:cellulose synthase/poly-beta-1,6-N-acetylglucosamine synthase-like glycosyltransferase
MPSSGSSGARCQRPGSLFRPPPLHSPLEEMHSAAVAVVVAPAVLLFYAYCAYPVALWTIARMRRSSPPRPALEGMWPAVTITVPVYNSVATMRATLERLLAVDYPKDRLQLLVISDASTDGTDDIVRGMADRGVELLRLPKRIGKTAAENAALSAATGEIIVNVDATIIVPRDSLKPLIRAFDDPVVGVASGRDTSVGDAGQDGTRGESSYTGYEMWLRDLETTVGSIVGASGCFYGIRRAIHSDPLPIHLSWDFASPLVARKKGFRSISVPAAVCIVPRTSAIQTEIRRKVRTMARGLRTLFYLRALMNPVRYGGFAVMLVSHKLLRWIPYLLAPFSLIALALLATGDSLAALTLGVFALTGLAGFAGMRTANTTAKRALAVPSFLVAVFCAGFLAWREAIRGTSMATWEPTPRAVAQS